MLQQTVSQFDSDDDAECERSIFGDETTERASVTSKRRRRPPTQRHIAADQACEDTQQRIADVSFRMQGAAASSHRPSNRGARDEGGGGGDIYEADAVFELGPYRKNTFKDLDTQDEATDPTLRRYWHECQLCNVDQTPDEKQAFPELEQLKTFAEIQCYQTDPINLAKQLQRMYNETIRPCIENTPPMRASMFWEHFDSHAPTPRWMTESSLRNMSNILRVLRDEQTFETNPVNGQQRINHRNAMLTLRIEKERRPILKQITELRASDNNRITQ